MINSLKELGPVAREAWLTHLDKWVDQYGDGVSARGRALEPLREKLNQALFAELNKGTEFVWALDAAIKTIADPKREISMQLLSYREQTYPKALIAIGGGEGWFYHRVQEVFKPVFDMFENESWFSNVWNDKVEPLLKDAVIAEYTKSTAVKTSTPYWDYFRVVNVIWKAYPDIMKVLPKAYLTNSRKFSIGAEAYPEELDTNLSRFTPGEIEDFRLHYAKALWEQSNGRSFTQDELIYMDRKLLAFIQNDRLTQLTGSKANYYVTTLVLHMNAIATTKTDDLPKISLVDLMLMLPKDITAKTVASVTGTRTEFTVLEISELARQILQQR